MENMIVINNLNFKYDNKKVFNNFNLYIKKGSFTTIIGNNGSGKTTLTKLLTGIINSNNIYIDNVLISKENLPTIRKNMGAVIKDYNDTFICETVYEELIYPHTNSNTNIEEIISILGIKNLLNKNPMDLSNGQKQLVNIGCALIKKTNLIILDEAFTMIDDITKEKILEYLKKLNTYGTTIVNITSDIEQSLYGDSIVVIDKGHIIIQDDKVSVYKQEKTLKKLGINLPFMVDLSKRLSYYNLVDDIIFNMNDMINVLWK